MRMDFYDCGYIGYVEDGASDVILGGVSGERGLVYVDAGDVQHDCVGACDQV